MIVWVIHVAEAEKSPKSRRLRNTTYTRALGLLSTFVVWASATEANGAHWGRSANRLHLKVQHFLPALTITRSDRKGGEEAGARLNAGLGPFFCYCFSVLQCFTGAARKYLSLSRSPTSLSIINQIIYPINSLISPIQIFIHLSSIKLSSVGIIHFSSINQYTVSTHPFTFSIYPHILQYTYLSHQSSTSIHSSILYDLSTHTHQSNIYTFIIPSIQTFFQPSVDPCISCILYISMYIPTIHPSIHHSSHSAIYPPSKILSIYP